MIIAVDFDETIYTVGQEVPGAIASLNILKSKGHTLMLFTNRTGVTLNQALSWLSDKFAFDSYNNDVHWWQKLFITASKPYADKFIDDRNVGQPLVYFMGLQCVDWPATLKLLGINA